jgi:hypothetical protein
MYYAIMFLVFYLANSRKKRRRYECPVVVVDGMHGKWK